MQRQRDKEGIHAIRELAAVSSWSLDRTAEAIRLRYSVSRLRAYRLASGWTLVEVAARIQATGTINSSAIPRIGHGRVSRWETGDETPSPRYLDALCRIYRTRADLLGFGVDYSQQKVDGGLPRERDGNATNGLSPVSLVSVSRAESSTASPERKIRSEQYCTGSQDQDSAVGRSFAAAIPAGDHSSVAWAADQTRLGIVEVLQKRSIRDASLDWWEEQARYHGRAYRVIPLTQLLSKVVVDLAAIQQILIHRQPVKSQRRLSGVVAQLAGLVGIICIDLHRPKDASKWFQAGRIAATEAGNSTFSAWLTTREALSYFYYGSADEAISLARSARRLAGPSPSTPAAMAPAVEARALVRVGQTQDALKLLRHSGEVFFRLPKEVQSAGVFGFSEQKLRFYESNILTHTNAWRAAHDAQERALELYGLRDEIDRGHILLDRAMCLLRQDELEEATRSACQVLVNLTTNEGIGALLAHATELFTVASRRHRREATVKALQEVIFIRRRSLSLQELATKDK